MTNAEQFSSFIVADFQQVDPRGGVLVGTTYWRPHRRDRDPEHPGEKVSVLSYVAVKANALCPCGSGRRFAHCCRTLPNWRPLCPNPRLQGHSLMHPQIARFAQIPVKEVTTFLDEAAPLYAISATFWTYWGNPAYDTSVGTICFGDIEVDADRHLVVTALSDVRMEALLALLAPLALGEPVREYDPLPQMSKSSVSEPS